ncbi:uncharacterized protein LOC123447466 [Hordeum vulgare subsp. vulgare]|uniref:uncharacterized protein LOC123447466 n=1 Tax=Hordeum vulgare subsp. vulgare TaxID=112509 RepID=UPI00162BA5DF|nr:uncharacterized protein LOC123447466 [Hordeum vulgare subsp. vulgare]
MYAALVSTTRVCSLQRGKRSRIDLHSHYIVGSWLAMAKRLAVALLLLVVALLASCDGRELKGKGGGTGGAVDEAKDLVPRLPPLVPNLPPLPPDLQHRTLEFADGHGLR